MIQNLITTTAKALETGLALPDGDKQTSILLSDPPPLKKNDPLPLIHLYPGKLNIDSSPRSNVVVEDEDKDSTIREFNQDLLIDVYDDTIENIEKWSSLITGVILIEGDKLIKNCNKATTPYKAGLFSSLGIIDRLRFVTSTPNADKDFFKMNMIFKVTGRIRMIKTVDDGRERIKVVELNVSKG